MRLRLVKSLILCSSLVTTCADESFRKGRTIVRRANRLVVGKRLRRRLDVPHPSTSTKAPTPSTKQPSSPSTKQPSLPSTKQPSLPSTKQPSSPSTKQPSSPSTKRPTNTATGVPTITSTKAPSLTPSKAPNYPSTKKPSHFPTKQPTKAPSKPPTQAPLCTLEANLGFPNWEDPDDATHFGYHTDYLSVFRGEDEGDICDSTLNPDWCEYTNTAEGGTSAYIGNIDDFYYPDEADIYDQMQEETIIISNAQDKIHYLCVEHWFNSKDYYPEYYTWMDHMMAAVLTVKKNGVDMGGDWSHPVDIDTPSHIKDKGEEKVNPDYEDYFCITVTCTDACDCTADDYSVYYA